MLLIGRSVLFLFHSPFLKLNFSKPYIFYVIIVKEVSIVFSNSQTLTLMMSYYKSFYSHIGICMTESLMFDIFCGTKVTVLASWWKISEDLPSFV